MEMQRSKAKCGNWSNLPTEIVQSIAQLLRKIKDLQNFRLVCKNWQRSTLISAFLPHTTVSVVPEKVISSSILLLRPLNSPDSPPFMALAVEPFKGVIKLFNPFTRTQLADIDLACYRSTQLTTAYHVVVEDHGDLDIFSNSSCPYIKVLICYKAAIPIFRHCGMLTLSDGGRMYKSKPFTKYKTHEKSSCRDADDVERFEGRTYALNEEGKLCLSCSDDICHFCLQITDPTNCSEVKRRKRLAVMKSSSAEKLFMVVPLDGEGGYLHFKVYRLTKNEKTKNETGYKPSKVWLEVTSFGDVGQVLFVSRDHCFFVAAGEFQCQLRNCIVYSDDAFPWYSESKTKPAGWGYESKSKPDWNYEGKVGNDVAIYSLGGQGSSCSIYAGCYPGFPVMLWSPPPLISPIASSPLQSQPQSEFEEVEMIQQSDFNIEDSTAEESDSEDKESESDSEGKESESDSEGKESETESDSEDIVSPNAAGAETTSFLAVNDIEHVNEEASHLEVSRTECSNAQSTHSVTRAYITSITQNNQSDNATVKFEGLEIRPNLLSTLQKVWSKYGNLIENITIRNGDIVSRALESLATTILILEDNSVGALTDPQAEYLSSTLSDLRCMQFKVDWLVPYVEKAVEIHKSKPLLESRDKLGHCKAQVSEKISKTLEELAALNKLADELDEEIASLSKVIPFSGNVDLDKPLGGGLS